MGGAATLVGTKKELAACMGAENMLKQEGASLAQLKKMSHDKMVKQVQIHRKEVAVCRVRLAGLNAHLVECARCKAQMTHIKTKSKKMREAISKETSVEAAQYSEKAKDLA